MSFQEKNIAVSLANFSLILGFFLIRLFQMVQNGTLTPDNVFRTWGIIIIITIVVTILATILTHIVSAIIEVIRTGDDDPQIEDFADERDKLIDLKGTRVTYTVAFAGTFFAMLTFVFDQPPLIMFILLIFFGVSAQIVGDAWRLYLYRRGF